MKAKLSLLIPLLTIVGLVACTAAIPMSSTSTVAPTSMTTTTIAASPMPILVDANGVEIGYRVGFDEIYVPSIRRIIAWPQLYKYYPTVPITSFTPLYFATADCSGIGYVDYNQKGSPKLYAYVSYKGLITVADDTDPIQIKPSYVQSSDGSCRQSYDLTITYFLEAEYVTLPFTVLALPLKFKQ